VGCESCHGPGEAHALKKDDKDLYPLINPFRPSDAERKAGAAAAQVLFTKRMERIEQFCLKCHNEENDVHWFDTKFLDRWVNEGIVHNDKKNVGSRWLPKKK
jgi:hypothetical protein